MIQGESSETVILGSFRLNCSKEQFFHDKQMASVPQQHREGPESPRPQGLGARGVWDWHGPAGIAPTAWRCWETTRGTRPKGSGCGRAVRRLPEIKNQRKPLPSGLLTAVLGARASSRLPALVQVFNLVPIRSHPACLVLTQRRNFAQRAEPGSAQHGAVSLHPGEQCPQPGWQCCALTGCGPDHGLAPVTPRGGSNAQGEREAAVPGVPSPPPQHPKATSLPRSPEQGAGSLSLVNPTQ